MTKGAPTSTQINSPTQQSTGLSSSSTMTTSSADTSPPASGNWPDNQNTE